MQIDSISVNDRALGSYLQHRQTWMIRSVSIIFRVVILLLSVPNLPVYASATVLHQNETVVIPHDDDIIDENSVFTSNFEKPEFVGGRIAFQHYLGMNMAYPEDALKNSVEGGVLVKFVVEKDGSITNSEILRGVSTSLDAEAIRLISQMPQWRPGKLGNKLMRVQVIRLVEFRLDFNYEKEKGQSISITMDEAIDTIMMDIDGTYLLVPEMPKYLNGPESLHSYIRQNRKYPTDAVNNGIEGRVLVQFIVEKDGSITNPIVVRGLYPSLDAEAIRIISSMPKWTPGKINGQSCRVKYTMPISFRL